jgi:hypothetical protein
MGGMCAICIYRCSASSPLPYQPQLSPGGRGVGGWVRGMSGGGGGCKSDLTTTRVEMYWLSPLVRLRLSVSVSEHI